MGLRLQRQLGPVTHLTSGQYTVETASGEPAICCPSCGGISDLPDTHEVSRGGEVGPIWSCPFETCPFVDFVALEAWGEDVVPA